MKPITLLLSLILIVAVACSPDSQTTVQDTISDAQSAVTPTEEPMMDSTDMTEEPMMDDSSMDSTDMTEEPMMDDSSMDSTDVMYNGPDWTHIELVNVATNETFTLADFAGKTVFIEPMAVWCTNCRANQRTVNTVIDQLDPDQFVMLSLSIETFVTPEELNTYAINNEFGWTFAVATDDLVSALVSEFGRGVTSPPSVPHFTIAPDGTVGNFKSGAVSADDFLSLVRSVAAGS